MNMIKEKDIDNTIKQVDRTSINMLETQVRQMSDSEKKSVESESSEKIVDKTEIVTVRGMQAVSTGSRHKYDKNIETIKKYEKVNGSLVVSVSKHSLKQSQTIKKNLRPNLGRTDEHKVVQPTGTIRTKEICEDIKSKSYTDVKLNNTGIKGVNETFDVLQQNLYVDITGSDTQRSRKQPLMESLKIINKIVKFAATPSFLMFAFAGLMVVIVISGMIISSLVPQLSDGEGKERVQEINNSLNSKENAMYEELEAAGYNVDSNLKEKVYMFGDMADYEEVIALFYTLQLTRGEEFSVEELYWGAHEIKITKTQGMYYNSGRYDAFDTNGNVVELLVSTEVKDASGKTSKVNVQKDGDDSKDADVHAPIECKTWFVNVKALNEKEFLEQWNLSEDELEYYEFYCSEEGRELIYGSDVDLEELLPAAESKNVMLELVAKELENQEKDDTIKTGDKYKSWFGYTVEVEWDMIFLTYLAAQAGLVDEYYVNNLDKVDSGVLQDAGQLPFTSSREWAENWFKAKGLWKSGTYAPQPGDYVFLDEDADGSVDSVGLVAGMDEQGNIGVYRAFSSAGILKESYKPDAEMIYGYGIFVAYVEVK